MAPVSIMAPVSQDATQNRGFLIAGNWKMNGLLANLAEVEAIAALPRKSGVDCALCLPATLIGAAAAETDLTIGAQDCHQNATGAHTGCLSAAMLAEAGAKLTIIGHSERRVDQHESDADIRAKAMAARVAGMHVILCVGESDAERETGKAVARVTAQLSDSLPEGATAEWLTVAYEPIWAIGTGKIPSVADVAEMHDAIRRQLVTDLGAAGRGVRILYGGSMNGDNAAQLLAIDNVDGGLVGGASLTAAKFAPIVMAANALTA